MSENSTPIVYKFGGASVRDAQGVRNLAAIVAREERPVVIVVSAMGKTTNALEHVVQALWDEDRPAARERWQQVLDAHASVADELCLPDFAQLVSAEQTEALRLMDAPRPASYDDLYDSVVSLGELLSTRIVCAWLNRSGTPAQWLEMPRILLTDSAFRDANVRLEESVGRLRAAMYGNVTRWVAQGFIGGDARGHRTTLGREGSDYSAALIANMLGASSVTIWKDVQGIYNADPRLVSDTVLIPELNYGDAVELAYSGAQIIHPKTIRPIENKHIPLYVRSFLTPDAPGSVIREGVPRLEGIPVYIWLQNQVLVTLRAKDFGFMLEESLSDIFDTIHRHRLKVSLIQSSAVTISVSVNASRHLDEAMRSLAERYKVTYNDHLALLTIRGTTPEIIEREKQGREVLLCQTTRRTAKLLVKQTIL